MSPPVIATCYRRRAEHCVGLIITEGTTIDHSVSWYPERVPAFHGRALDHWRRVADEVHTAGDKIAPQLWHVGAMRHPDNDDPSRHLPSASPSGLFYQVITVGSVGLSGAMSTRHVGEEAAVSTDVQPLADRIEAGEFDLVAVGRALLSDPCWAEKVKAGQFAALRPFGRADRETLYGQDITTRVIPAQVIPKRAGSPSARGTW